MRYNTKIGYFAKTKKITSEATDKRLWQTMVLIVISITVIIAFLGLPWIIISEDMKINILHFSISLNSIVNLATDFKDKIDNLYITGMNVRDSVDAIKLFKTVSYIAFAIPASNIILILITIFTKKMKTLLSFLLFINFTCIIISILEIILLNYLRFDYKAMIFYVYNNFHTDAYHVGMSITEFADTILMIVSQNKIVEVDGLTAIISSSSFMTIVLSLVSIAVAFICYFINIFSKNNKQAVKENSVLENI